MSASDFGPDHRVLPRIFANPKESQLAEITQLLFQSGSKGSPRYVEGALIPPKPPLELNLCAASKCSSGRQFSCSVATSPEGAGDTSNDIGRRDGSRGGSANFTKVEINDISKAKSDSLAAHLSLPSHTFQYICFDDHLRYLY